MSVRPIDPPPPVAARVQQLLSSIDKDALKAERDRIKLIRTLDELRKIAEEERTAAESSTDMAARRVVFDEIEKALSD